MSLHIEADACVMLPSVPLSCFLVFSVQCARVKGRGDVNSAVGEHRAAYRLSDRSGLRKEETTIPHYTLRFSLSVEHSVRDAMVHKRTKKSRYAQSFLCAKLEKIPARFVRVIATAMHDMNTPPPYPTRPHICVWGNL